MRLRIGPELKLRPEPPEDDERIINFCLSDEDFEIFKTLLAEDREKFLKYLEEHKVELPETQAELSGFANSAVEDVVRQYDLDLPDSFYKDIEVYPLYADAYKQAGLAEGEETEEGNPDNVGKYLPEMRAALLWYPKKSRLPEKFQNVRFLHTAIHEIVHAKAYHALQAFRKAGEQKPEVAGYRTGLDIVKLGQSEKIMFRELDEGLTEMLAVEALNEAINNNRDTFKDLILDDIERKMTDRRSGRGYIKAPLRDRMQELDYDPNLARQFSYSGWRDPVRQDIRDKIFDSGYTYEQPARYQSYSKEQKLVRELIAAIARENPDYEGREDEIKALFFKAYFTGRMLDLGRLVEKTFGKGTFRLIAEKPFSPELHEKLKI